MKHISKSDSMFPLPQQLPKQSGSCYIKMSCCRNRPSYTWHITCSLHSGRKPVQMFCLLQTAFILHPAAKFLTSFHDYTIAKVHLWWSISRHRRTCAVRTGLPARISHNLRVWDSPRSQSHSWPHASAWTCSWSQIPRSRTRYHTWYKYQIHVINDGVIL